MRRTLHLLGTTAFLVSALVATSGVASANPAEDYRDAMGPFAADIAAWAADVEVAVMAAHENPTAIDAEALADLARIGKWTVADLEGTAALAPASLADAHVGLTVSVARIADAAMTAQRNPDKAVLTIGLEMAEFATRLGKIRDFAAHAFRGSRTAPGPRPPATES